MTFSDPITPKSFPEKLQGLDYDPHALMPESFPEHPRVWVDKKQVEHCKNLLHQGQPEVLFSMKRLVKNIEENRGGEDLLRQSKRCAIAYHLKNEESYFSEALESLRNFAHQQLSKREEGNVWNDIYLGLNFSIAYDLLLAFDIGEADRELFKNLFDLCQKKSRVWSKSCCNNIWSWILTSHLALGSVFSDRQTIHEALYGYQAEQGFKYGIIHQLRHDFLSDGLHWERSLGYHYFTLMSFTEMATILGHLGVDLWNKKLPPQFQSDGSDQHRCYGPMGLQQDNQKCLKAAFDAPLYAMSSINGDYSLIHDSGLDSVATISTWGILYEKAYEVYRDERYAWLLNKIDSDFPKEKRKIPELPMSLNANHGEFDFIRLKYEDYPGAVFQLSKDECLSLKGKHQDGCSLFPDYGMLILRQNPDTSKAHAAQLFFGPHAAGHQNPIGLNLDIFSNGKPLTHHAGYMKYDYGSERCLGWARTTLAHNSLVVDQKSVFPHDFDDRSIFDCEQWRDRVSDSELIRFKTESMYKIAQCRNSMLYPGCVLDRSILLGPDFLVDLYRVDLDAESCVDFAYHLPWELKFMNMKDRLKESQSLGDGHGYDYLDSIEKIVLEEGHDRLECQIDQSFLTTTSLQKAEYFQARERAFDDEESFDIGNNKDKNLLLARVHAKRNYFLSCWSFSGEKIEIVSPVQLDDAFNIHFEMLANKHRYSVQFGYQQREEIRISRS